MVVARKKIGKKLGW